MNPALKNLKDIHLPPAVGYWPFAPGWFALLLFITLVILYIFYRWYERYCLHYSARHALKKLKLLKPLLLLNPQDINVAAEVSTLIRRTALSYYDRETIAGLAGEDWIQFLNTCTRIQCFTDKSVKHLLTDVPYRKSQSEDLTPLISSTEHWLSTLISTTKQKVRHNV